MDNNIFELFSKMMMGNTSNFNSSSNNYQNNPAFSSYPKEAYSFVQNENNQNNTNFSSNNEQKSDFINANFNNENLNSNNNNQNNFFNSFANLFENDSNNNILPLLMSLLGKNTNLSTLSEIFGTQKKNSDNDKNNKDTFNNNIKNDTPTNEILL